MKRLRSILVVLLCLVAGLLFVGWLGFQIRPARFPEFPRSEAELATIPLPGGLPAPVERFYRQVYGERVPVIHSAVVTGWASMRRGGIRFPGRFRITHLAGQGYRHYIEATWFGLPFIKVNEHYLDGQAEFGPAAGPKLNQAANLGLWAESIWLPTIWITDARVRWEVVDEQTAMLVVPFGDGVERYVVRFDPESGLPSLMESMRYKDVDSPGKTLWLNQSLAWAPLNGSLTGVAGAAMWFDEGTPWAVFHVEDIVFNADVTEYVRADGP